MAAAIAVQDVRFEDRTCGSALVSTDPSQVVVLTGDPAIDDFEAERLSGSCNRRILRTRFLVAVPLTVAGVAIYLYLRPEPDRSLHR